MVLKGIFGNRTASMALLQIFHHGELHPSAIAHDSGIALTPVLNQMNRFEECGILVSKQVGRSRVYSFNPKSPFANKVKELLDIYYNSMSLEDKQVLFPVRRRPLEKGKPVI